MQLNYENIGHGPDILLLHGWASSARMWRRLMVDLEGHARCWAVDLAGFGQSPCSDDEILGINEQASLIKAFCEQHNLRPKAIIGHSMGGMITLKLALAWPDLMENIVLICPAVTGRLGFNIDQWVTSEMGQMAVGMSAMLWPLAQSSMLAPLLSVPSYVDQAAAVRIAEDFQRSTWKASIDGLLSMAKENLGPYLNRIPHPTLVIVGSMDTTVPPQEGRLAAHHIPYASLITMNGRHHQPTDESPEQITEAIKTFLRL